MFFLFKYLYSVYVFYTHLMTIFIKSIFSSKCHVESCFLCFTQQKCLNKKLRINKCFNTWVDDRRGKNVISYRWLHLLEITNVNLFLLVANKKKLSSLMITHWKQYFLRKCFRIMNTFFVTEINLKYMEEGN